jgi:membrane protein DedA with SNARE-associated domain
VSDWIIRLIEQSGYLGIGFLMFLETVFPPVPSEVIMSIAGVTAAQGKLDIYGVIAAGTAGAMLGNIVWYLAARALGVDRLRPFVARHGRWLTLDWREIERAERWFARFGTFFVFMGRLLPTVRSLVSIPAGLLRMRFKSFFIASTIGTAGWTAILAAAGYQLQQNVEDVGQFIGPISNAIIAVLIGGYLWRLWRFKPEAAEKNVSNSD